MDRRHSKVPSGYFRQWNDFSRRVGIAEASAVGWIWLQFNLYAARGADWQTSLVLMICCLISGLLIMAELMGRHRR